MRASIESTGRSLLSCVSLIGTSDFKAPVHARCTDGAITQRQFQRAYGNVLVKTIKRLFKAQAILDEVGWFKNRPLLEPIQNITPAETEANFYAVLKRVDMAAYLRQTNRHKTRAVHCREARGLEQLFI